MLDIRYSIYVPTLPAVRCTLYAIFGRSFAQGGGSKIWIFSNVFKRFHTIFERFVSFFERFQTFFERFFKNMRIWLTPLPLISRKSNIYSEHHPKFFYTNPIFQKFFFQNPKKVPRIWLKIWILRTGNIELGNGRRRVNGKKDRKIKRAKRVWNSGLNVEMQRHYSYRGKKNKKIFVDKHLSM